MSILKISDEQKAEILKKHRTATKADRDNRDAMNGGIKSNVEKKKERKKEKED